MKKIVLFLLLCSSLNSKANTHIIQVSNFQFSPGNLNVVVGDIIRWQWSSGFHNTASMSVPPNAADWISPFMSGTGDFFEYTVTEPGSYEYFCEVHGTGMSGTFTASGTMPVTLTSFMVGNQQSKPYLSWTTSMEQNTDYYSIHRSYDGINFSEIARVPAAGNSNEVRNYAFLDNRVSDSRRFVYYELGITDIDGKVQLSPIRLFKNMGGTQKLITSLSPNPVSAAGHLLISFNADEKTTLLARVIDLSGKTVVSTTLYAAEGHNNGHIHLGDLAAGNYVVQFSMGQKTESYKIRKQ
jgi:plastocyanin